MIFKFLKKTTLFDWIIDLKKHYYIYKIESYWSKWMDNKISFDEYRSINFFYTQKINDLENK